MIRIVAKINSIRSRFKHHQHFEMTCCSATDKSTLDLVLRLATAQSIKRHDSLQYTYNNNYDTYNNSTNKQQHTHLILIPLCFSISIKSLLVALCSPFILTAPAVCSAPPYSSSFSVMVVLPLSGCDIMARLRRRLISSAGAA